MTTDNKPGLTALGSLFCGLRSYEYLYIIIVLKTHYIIIFKNETETYLAFGCKILFFPSFENFKQI